MKTKLTNKILIPAAAIVFAVFILLSGIPRLKGEGYEHSTVYIRRGNEIVEKISIEHLEDTYRAKLETNTVCIEKDGVYMEDAACPDKLCVRSGRIDSPGESIVCLPNKIMVEIINENSDVDAVAGAR